MKVKDRLRAKKPPENDDRWRKCKIIEIGNQIVKIEDKGEKIDLKLTAELIDLFESRVQGDTEGSTAWYIKK